MDEAEQLDREGPQLRRSGRAFANDGGCLATERWWAKTKVVLQ